MYTVQLLATTVAVINVRTDAREDVTQCVTDATVAKVDVKVAILDALMIVEALAGGASAATAVPVKILP